MVVEVKKRGSAVVVVYIRGTEPMDMWYRLELPMTQELLLGKRKRNNDFDPFPRARRISPVAKLYGKFTMSTGSWEAIGEDIYWIGGCEVTAGKAYPGFLSASFRKHNIRYDDPSLWVDASPPMSIPRLAPFVASFTTGKSQQLCVLAGFNVSSKLIDLPFESLSPITYPDDDDVDVPDDVHVDVPWDKCGQVYDLRTKTWTLLNADFKCLRPYFCTDTQSAQDVEDPTRLVFYSPWDGTMLFLDAPSGKISHSLSQPNFCLSFYKDPTSQGFRYLQEVEAVRNLAHIVRAVFAGDTFYWCSPDDIRLYAYDIVRQQWLMSPSLKHQFPSVYYTRDDPIYPILLGLPNGKFVLIVAGKDELFTMAFLTVKKKGRGTRLSVSVDFARPFYFDDPSFRPLNGKAFVEG